MEGVMPDQSYRIRIASQGYEYEAEGDKEFVLEMLKRFERKLPQPRGTKKQPQVESLQSPDSESIPDVARLGSPAEFIRQLKFRQHTDIVLAFGYYLEQSSALKEFTPADINNLYYEAKIESSNTSMSCIRNTKRGYMMEAKGTKKGAKKRYTLTRTGEDYIESALQSTPD
jgi:hypothetical protein